MPALSCHSPCLFSWRSPCPPPRPPLSTHVVFCVCFCCSGAPDLLRPPGVRQARRNRRLKMAGILVEAASETAVPVTAASCREAWTPRAAHWHTCQLVIAPLAPAACPFSGRARLRGLPMRHFTTPFRDLQPSVSHLPLHAFINAFTSLLILTRPASAAHPTPHASLANIFQTNPACAPVCSCHPFDWS